MRINRVLTPDDRERILDYIAGGDIFAFDIETNSGHTALAKIIGIGFTDELDNGYYLPLGEWDKEDKKFIWYGQDYRDLGTDILKALRVKRLVMHGGVFDIVVTRNDFDIDLLPAFYADTMYMKHTINENRPHGLEDCVIKYEDKILLKGETTVRKKVDILHNSIKENGGSIAKKNYELYKADMPIIAEYGIADNYLTLRLFEYFQEVLEKTGQVELFYDQEVMPLAHHGTVPMRYHGVPINPEYFRALKNEVEDGILELEEQVYSEINNDIQPYVDKLINKLVNKSRTGLFGKAGLKYLNIPVPVTKDGKETVSVKAIEKLIPEYDCTYLQWLMWRPKYIEVDGVKTQDPNHPEPILPDDLVLNIKRKAHFDKNPEDRVFNLGSLTDLRWLFFTKYKCKWDPQQVTDAGLQKVDEDFLSSKFVKGIDWVPKLLKIRKEEKILGTYINGILDRQVNGYIYPTMHQQGTTSGRYSSANPNFQNLPSRDKRIKKGIVAPPGYKIVNADFCLHPKTDILTERGWVPILDVSENDLIWQVNKDTLVGSWTKPIRIINREYKGRMFTFGNKRGTLTVTENHSMLWAGQYHSERKDKELLRRESLSQEGIPTTGCHMLVGSCSSNTVSDFKKEDIWMACMLQADSRLYGKTGNFYSVEVSKLRKREKVKELIGREGKVNDFVRDGHNLPIETWHGIVFHHPLLTDKTLNPELIGSNQLDEFVNALRFWDGSDGANNSTCWGSTDKSLVERVQARLIKDNYEAKMSKREFSNSNHSTYYFLRIKKKRRLRLRTSDVTQSFYEGKVGCVTVPEGFITVRSEGQTFVTGNCSLEPRIFSWITRDPGLLKVWNEGRDLYSYLAIKVLGNIGGSSLGLDIPPEATDDPKDANYLKKLAPEVRDAAKAFTLSVPYGSNAYAMHMKTGWPVDVCQNLIDAYLEKVPGLKDYMEVQEEMARELGYVETRFGRVRHLPEAKYLWRKFGDTIYNKMDMAFDSIEEDDLYEEMLWEWGDIKRRIKNAKTKNEKMNLYKERAALKKEIFEYGAEGVKLYGKFRNMMNNAKNSPIQMSAAHVANAALIKYSELMEKHNIDGWIMLQIHDEIASVVREDQAELAAKLLEESMEDNWITNQIDIPIFGEPAIADSFDEAK